MGVVLQTLRKRHPRASSAALKKLAAKQAAKKAPKVPTLPALPKQSKPPEPDYHTGLDFSAMNPAQKLAFQKAGLTPQNTPWSQMVKAGRPAPKPAAGSKPPQSVLNNQPPYHVGIDILKGTPQQQAGFAKAGLTPKNTPASTNVQPGQAHPAVKPPTVPGSPSAGSAKTAAPKIDPRDATYQASIARMKFDIDQRRTELDQQSGYARTDFQEALRRMLEQRPKDTRSARESANKAGLLRSGKLGEQLGEIETDYSRRQSDSQQSFDRNEAAREATRRALQAGFSIDEAAAYAEAMDRQLARDEASALSKSLAPPAKSAAAAQPKAKKKKAKPKKKSKK